MEKSRFNKDISEIINGFMVDLKCVHPYENARSLKNKMRNPFKIVPNF